MRRDNDFGAEQREFWRNLQPRPRDGSGWRRKLHDPRRVSALVDLVRRKNNRAYRDQR